MKRTHFSTVSHWLFKDRKGLRCRQAYSAKELFAIFEMEVDNTNAICNRTFSRFLNTFVESPPDNKFRLHKCNVSHRKHAYIILGATDSTDLKRIINIKQRKRQPPDCLFHTLSAISSVNSTNPSTNTNTTNNNNNTSPITHANIHANEITNESPIKNIINTNESQIPSPITKNPINEPSNESNHVTPTKEKVRDIIEEDIASENKNSDKFSN